MVLSILELHSPYVCCIERKGMKTLLNYYVCVPQKRKNSYVYTVKQISHHTHPNCNVVLTTFMVLFLLWSFKAAKFVLRKEKQKTFA